MESITRNVAEIDATDRQALEHVVGRQLLENQQVVIQIVNIDVPPVPANGKSPPGKLPEWCNVDAGLSDAEVAEIEQVVLTRADLSRATE
jgi:hypothetical protein